MVSLHLRQGGLPDLKAIGIHAVVDVVSYYYDSSAMTVKVTWQDITEVVTHNASVQPGLDVISMRLPTLVSAEARQFVRLRVDAK
jgi:hypothetical protein